MTPSYRTAMAAGADAANKRMRKQGRAEWDEDDFNLAAETARKIMALITETH